jgi:3-dehydroquinate synthase
MSTTVTVGLGSRSYPIRVGGWPEVEFLALLKGRRGLIVTDSTVGPLYGARCEATLREAGASVVRATVPAGESSKSMQQAMALYGSALDAGLDRKSFILALGGGMVGDLAGFVAATYLRGVEFLQVPTTLLAMVDSSVGGKTAVNLPQGKNLVGVFHQPSRVVADLSTLATLPAREYASGLAEVVKYGVIKDARLFEVLDASADKVVARDAGLLESIVATCCEIKAGVVARDERETGERAILNFGHTLGHAIEKLTEYSGWFHGEAVSVGMVFAARLSSEVRGFPAADAVRVERLLERLSLPVRPPAGLGWRAVRQAMTADKKTEQGIPRFVLSDRMGSVSYGCVVDEAAAQRVFDAMV